MMIIIKNNNRNIKTIDIGIFFIILFTIIIMLNGCYSYRDRYVSRPNLVNENSQIDLRYVTIDSLFYIQVRFEQIGKSSFYYITYRYLIEKKMKLNSLNFSIIDAEDTVLCSEFVNNNFDEYKEYLCFDSIPEKYKYIGSKENNLFDFKLIFSENINGIKEFPENIYLIIKTTLVDLETKDTLFLNKKYKYFKYKEKGPIWL